MRQKIPYLVIGVLIGIIVMQWGMPVAESQTGVVRANTFVLEDDFGNSKAMFFVKDDGNPLIGIGRPNEANIILSVSESGVLMVGGTDDTFGKINVIGKNVGIIAMAEDMATISAQYGGANMTDYTQLSASEHGGSVMTGHDGKSTGHLPLLPGTATKPVTWGQIKENSLGSSATAAKLVTICDWSDVEQLKEEYRQKMESLR